MKVLYDYQIFDTQVVGGISRYHADLIEGLKQTGNVEPLLGLLYSDNVYLKQSGLEFKRAFSYEDSFLWGIHFKNKDLLYKVLVKMGYTMHSSWELNAQYCRSVLHDCVYDVFHPTNYSDTYKDVSIGVPMVLTIHDMIFERFPIFVDKMTLLKNKKELAERSEAIIAISNSTKNEILNYYDNIDESKVHVVHHGIDLCDIKESPVIEEKANYILYVGGRWSYKDFYTLLKALKIIKQCGKKMTLVVCGYPFNANDNLYIDFLGLTGNVKNLNHISDNELKELYRNAQMFVSTSMDEGFGLPLLECMKFGTPMVLSDIPVYREIAGDAASYFKTSDERSLADVISQLYNNTKLQKALIAKGRERLLKYDKKKMIENTLAIYHKLL